MKDFDLESAIDFLVAVFIAMVIIGSLVLNFYFSDSAPTEQPVIEQKADCN